MIRGQELHAYIHGDKDPPPAPSPTQPSERTWQECVGECTRLLAVSKHDGGLGNQTMECRHSVRIFFKYRRGRYVERLCTNTQQCVVADRNWFRCGVTAVYVYFYTEQKNGRPCNGRVAPVRGCAVLLAGLNPNDPHTGGCCMQRRCGGRVLWTDIHTGSLCRTVGARYACIHSGAMADT